MQLQEVAGALWRYKLAIPAALALAFGGAGLGLARTTRIYEATAQLLIVQANPTLRNLFEDRLPGDESNSFARESNPISTDAELLKTKPLIEETIAELHLKDRKKKAPLPAVDFLKDLKITPLKGTDLIRVSYRNPDPAVAASAVNVLCERFAAANVETARRDATETLRFLRQQILTTRRRLTELDATLEAYKKANANYDLKTELEGASLGVNALTRQIAEADIDVAAQKRKVEALVRQLGLSPSRSLSQVGLGSHPTLLKLLGALNEARTNPILTSGLGPQHPQVIAAEAQIRRIRGMLDAEVRKLGAGRDGASFSGIDELEDRAAKTLLDQQVSYLGAQARSLALRQELEAFKARQARLPAIERRLIELSREREFTTDIYRQLLKRREEARVAQAMSVGNVRIVQPAEAPSRPIQPDVRLTLLAALVLGLAGGGGVALGLDRLDDRLRNPARARAALAPIPLSAHLPDHGQALLTDPDAPAVLEDAYGLVRLDLVRQLGPQFKLLFSAAGTPDIAPIVANLALSFARNGRRVLLVDGNLRQPTLYRRFALQPHATLRELLMGDAGWEEVATKVAGLPLWVIASVEAVEHPLNLLDTPRLWALNQTLTNFDVVLGIAPPIVAAPDALALARIFDHIGLILHHARTTRKDVIESKRIFADAGQAVGGSILVTEPVGGNGSWPWLPR